MKKLLTLLFIIPVIACYSQEIKLPPGGSVTVKANECPVVTCPTCPPSTTVVIRDTIWICPPALPVDTIPASPTLRKNLIFEASFEGTNPFDEKRFYKQGCCSYSITKTDVAREGINSFRAEVRSTDKAVSSGYRAELTTSADNLAEAWYGYSTYFLNWNAFSGGEHVIQWHPPSSSGSADLSLQTASNRFEVVRSINGANFRQSAGLKTIESNRWYDFVWHVKWSTGNDGIIELWIDGVKYFTYTGRTCSSGIPYFKFGINRWNMGNSSRVLYYDNLRIGNEKATYNDVAPETKKLVAHSFGPLGELKLYITPNSGIPVLINNH